MRAGAPAPGASQAKTSPAAGPAPASPQGPAAQATGGKAPGGPGGPGAPGGGPAVPVTARVLKSERLDNTITSSGNVLANEEVEIRSEVQGKIRRISFKEGGKVKKGDLLVKIDDAELQARSLQAQSRRKLAEDNEYRMRMQLKIEAVSQREYDQALNELNLAKAESQLLRAQLDKTELRAPFGGVVGLKQVSDGAFVSSTTLITTLQEIDPVKVDFTVPGKYAGFIKAGQAVNFTIQGADTRHQGKVYAVDPRIDPESRTLRLRAMCPNPARPHPARRLRHHRDALADRGSGPAHSRAGPLRGRPRHQGLPLSRAARPSPVRSRRACARIPASRLPAAWP